MMTWRLLWEKDITSEHGILEDIRIQLHRDKVQTTIVPSPATRVLGSTKALNKKLRWLQTRRVKLWLLCRRFFLFRVGLQYGITVVELFWNLFFFQITFHDLWVILLEFQHETWESEMSLTIKPLYYSFASDSIQSHFN